MGGIVCAIPKFALLRFDGVPTDHRQMAKFDQQLRACFVQPQIVQAIADEGKGERACELLAMRGWDDKQRRELYEMLESLYEY